MRFGEKGKLSPKYTGTYEVFERIRMVAYRLALPMEFEKIHEVFHVSQLKRYIPDHKHILQPESIQLDKTLTYEQRLKILDHKVRSTRRKDVPIVKALWSTKSTRRLLAKPRTR